MRTLLRSLGIALPEHNARLRRMGLGFKSFYAVLEHRGEGVETLHSPLNTAEQARIQVLLWMPMEPMVDLLLGRRVCGEDLDKARLESCFAL